MKVVKIGRDLSNDYIISHPAVSRFHADLYLYDNNTMQLIEHSTAGTYVNNTYIHNTMVSLCGNEVLEFPDQNPISVSQLLSTSFENEVRIPERFNNYSQDSGNKEHTSKEHEYYAVNSITFGEALGLFFKGYVHFAGRSRRSEYWYMIIWNMIFMIIPVVNILWCLASLLPGLALASRRLHDTGKSAWFLLLNLIPVVGSIILLVWYCTDSDLESNKYGPSPKYTQNANCGWRIRLENVSFGQALSLYFKGYVDFSGRSRRTEYWYVVIWNMIFMIIPIVNILWLLATFLPGLALAVRRLHDSGKSGWFLLLSLIPIIGSIILLVWYFSDSEKETNKWGASPKYY